MTFTFDVKGFVFFLSAKLDIGDPAHRVESLICRKEMRDNDLKDHLNDDLKMKEDGFLLHFIPFIRDGF